MANEATNKVRFGLSDVAIAPLTGPGTYGDVTPIPGAVSLSTNPEGSTENFFADNGAYYTCVVNAGYKGDLEMALIPDSVKVTIFGWEIDANGALVEIADAVPKPFALLFKVKGDAKDRLNVFYNVTAERPSNENKTTENSASPTTEKLAVTMIPEEIGGKKVTKLSIEKSEANATAYSGFYDSVLTPSFTEASS